MIDKQPNTSEFAVVLSLHSGEITLKTESVKEFYFIEDIFSFCVTGKISFYDQEGVFEFGPITGNERVSISYGDSTEKQWTFIIYKLNKIQGDSSTESGTKQTIDIYFTDTMFYPLNFFQFSKSWKDTKISDIITDISEKILGISKWDWQEKSKEKLDYFYSPYWTPNTSINWLLPRATGLKSKNSGFCFFNNSQGTNLVTLDTLLDQSKLLTIADKDDGKYVFEDTTLFLYNKILGWSIKGLDNTALKKISGNTTFGYNSLTKSFLKETNIYTDSLKKHTVLGKYSLYNDKSDFNQGFNISGEISDKYIDNMQKYDWNKFYDTQQLISISVRGHEERHCGKLIEIKWPSLDKLSEQYNRKLKGKYLIKSITHRFTGMSTPSYLQKLVLIKNGYEDSEVTELVKSTKKNTVG